MRIIVYFRRYAAFIFKMTRRVENMLAQRCEKLLLWVKAASYIVPFGYSARV